MAREILVHLNVEVPDDDPRSAQEITDLVMGAIAVGSDTPAFADMWIVMAMSEEI